MYICPSSPVWWLVVTDWSSQGTVAVTQEGKEQVSGNGFTETNKSKKFKLAKFYSGLIVNLNMMVEIGD